MLRHVVFFALLAFASASLLQQAEKEGSKVEMDLGRATGWVREVDGKKQTTKFCKPGDKAEHCGKWVGEDGKVAATKSKVSVSASGVLTIDKVTQQDAGAYYLLVEKKPLAREGSAVLPPQINLTVLKRK